MPTYPAELPPPLLDGYAEEPDDAVLRTDVEQGLPRQRLRYSQHITRHTCQVLFTRAQYATFKNFWQNEIAKGAAWFDMLVMGASGPETKEVRFVAPFKAALIEGIYWRVQFELEMTGL